MHHLGIAFGRCLRSFIICRSVSQVNIEQYIAEMTLNIYTFPHNPLVHAYNSLKSVKGNNIIEKERIYCRAECKVTNFNLYKILGLKNSKNDLL